MDRMTDDELPPEIEAAWKALDARAAAGAARVDAEAVAREVVARLRREEQPRAWWLVVPPAVLRVAAAVALVAAAGVVVTVSRERPARQSASLPLAIPSADSLDASELEQALQAAGQVRPVEDTTAAATSEGSMAGLSERQLETLLASMKGAEG